MNLDTATGLGFLGFFISTYLLFIIGFGIIGIIAHWKLFEKADVDGWKAIVPILNFWEMIKIRSLPPGSSLIGSTINWKKSRLSLSPAPLRSSTRGWEIVMSTPRFLLHCSGLRAFRQRSVSGSSIHGGNSFTMPGPRPMWESGSQWMES